MLNTFLFFFTLVNLEKQCISLVDQSYRKLLQEELACIMNPIGYLQREINTRYNSQLLNKSLEIDRASSEFVNLLYEVIDLIKCLQ